VDPARSGINFYAYCVADPLNFSDPYGLSDSRETFYNLDMLMMNLLLPPDTPCGAREEAKKIVKAYVDAVFDERDKGKIFPWYIGNILSNKGTGLGNTCDEWSLLLRETLENLIGPKKDNNGKPQKQSECFSVYERQSNKPEHSFIELSYNGHAIAILDPWYLALPRIYEPKDYEGYKQ
jgi:hypothetical protein